MFDVGASLRGALDRAAQQLNDAQSAVVAANAGADAGRAADAAMAQTAQAVIFREALLTAQHGRLAEIKAAAR